MRSGRPVDASASVDPLTWKVEAPIAAIQTTSCSFVIHLSHQGVPGSLPKNGKTTFQNVQIYFKIF